MSTTNKLLLAVVVVLLMTGPAYPQNRDMLQLQKDVLDLKNAVSQMQSSFDQNNQALKSLVEKVFDQVNGLAGNIQKINQTVDAVNAHTDRSSAELKNTISALATKVSDLAETVAAVRSQLSGLSSQITTMNTKTEALPNADETWRAARLDVTVGNWDLALQELAEFQAKYPNDPRSAEAQILKGDALEAQKKHDQAIIEYDLFLQKFPENDKTSLALFKKGLAQVEANDRNALATLQQVVAKYPKSQEAPLAQAKIKELSAAGARGRRGPGAH